MIDCKELDGDGIWRLDQLLLLIPQLQKKYGKNNLIRFDAGYNNVQVKITPTKKVKENGEE